MANTKSVQKRARQSLKRAADNRTLRTRVKSARRALNEALEAGDTATATARYRVLTSVADRAAKSGVIHRNAADRLKGLYARRVAGVAPPAKEPASEPISPGS